MYSNFYNNEWKKKLDEDGYIVVKNSKYMKKNLKILKKKSSDLIRKEEIREAGKVKRNFIKKEKNLKVGLKDLED